MTGGEGGDELSTEALLAALAETPAEAGLIPDGTMIAERFRIAGKLGAGGMGVVYRANDTTLGRDVAIKVLIDHSDEGQQRLLREATAMAQLAHPNVVTAHDVGVWAHGVFIAMELVEGQNLRRWLEARPRGWREIRDVFVAAGEGLRAIHALGMVHRDFKPGNVLIDAAGRVRVSDLGLVRSAGQRAPVAADAPAILSDPLTRGSSVSGTPGFMAPEQLDGRPIDERSDQFAFCVAMEAALPGGAPARLLAALRRGRSADPAARFPSMTELLSALRYDPAQTRRRAAIAGLVVALAAAAAFGLVRRERRSCETASPWTDAARAAVREAFSRSGRAYAGDAFARVAAALDGYAARLGSTETTACGTGAPAIEACLAGDRAALVALIDALGKSDGAVVDRAVQAVGELPEPSSCRDAASAVPADRATREALGRLEPRLATITALELIGRYREGLALAPAVAAEAQRIGWPSLTARVLSTHAALLVDLREPAAAETLRAAWLAAARAGEDELAAIDLGRLIWFVGVHLGKPAEAEPLFAAAEAALARAGDRPLLRAVLLQQMGDVLITRGSYAPARRLQLEGLLLAEAGGERPHKRALSWNSLAIVDRRSGALAEAEQASRRAFELTVAALGPEHPQTAGTLMNVASVLKSRRRYDEALELTSRAAAIFDAAQGAESIPAGMARNNLAETLHLLGRNAEALAPVERALAIKEAAMPPGHPSIAGSHVLRARILLALGRGDEGLAAAQRGAAMLLERLGPRHEDTMAAELVIAAAQAAAGRAAEARAALALASPDDAEYAGVLARVEELARRRR